MISYIILCNKKIILNIKEVFWIYKNDNICPVCNGLITLEESCPNCKEVLEDSGYIESLFGPYAPYDEIGRQTNKKGNCVHEIVCPHCDKTWTINVNKLDF